MDWQVAVAVYHLERALCLFSCSLCPSAGVLNVCEVENLPLIIQDEEHMHKHILLMGTLPPLCLDIDIIHVIKRFCILQVIKNRTVGRLGNEASRAARLAR